MRVDNILCKSRF